MAVSPPGARGFECEALAVLDKTLNPLEHKPTGRDGGACRIKWREAARDFVSIDELVDVQSLGDDGGVELLFPAPLGPPMMTTSFN
jgi:hypothetical protein